MQAFDLIIVGGGVMGSAIATYLLKADPDLDILIIERDSTYIYSSIPTIVSVQPLADRMGPCLPSTFYSPIVVKQTCLAHTF